MGVNGDNGGVRVIGQSGGHLKGQDLVRGKRVKAGKFSYIICLEYGKDIS